MPTDTRDTPVMAFYRTNTWNPQGVEVLWEQGTRQVGRYYDSRTYVQARRRPEGFVNPKPYTRVVRSGQTDGISPFYAFGYGGIWVRQQGCSLAATNGRFAVPSFDEGLANRAILDARNKVKDQKINFGVAFAEAGRTGNLVADSAKRIAGAIRDVKKGRYREAAAAFGVTTPRALRKSQGKVPRSQTEAHQAWLEMQYGWKPLLSDVGGAAQALAQKDLQDPNRYMATVKSAKSARDVRSQTRANVSDANHPLYFIESQEHNMGAFVRLDYVQRHPNMATLAQAGFTNPLEIAWEVMPWSFIVDWFVPIGNYCSLLDADLGWDFLAGSITRRQRAKSTFGVQPRNIGWLNLTVSGAGSSSYFSMARNTYSSPPIPGFIVKNPISGTHVLNAIALMAAQFK